MRKLPNKYIDAGGHYELILRDTFIVKFDRDDLELVSTYHWRIDGKGYAITNVGKTIVKMHRLLTNFSTLLVDHINGDRIDNRRANLRLVEREHNNRNMGVSKRSTSGITGVTFDASSNKWHARIAINGKRVHLGLFTDIESAREARMDAESKYYGEYSRGGSTCYLHLI